MTLSDKYPLVSVFDGFFIGSFLVPRQPMSTRLGTGGVGSHGVLTGQEVNKKVLSELNRRELKSNYFTP